MTIVHTVHDTTIVHWWRAHFNTRIRIRRIHLVARQDCCENRISDNDIFSILNDPNTGSSSKILIGNTASVTLVNKAKFLDCDQIADGIIIESAFTANDGVLNFAEIYINAEEV